MRYAIIPIFIPHKGCPFDCIYCNQKTISGQIDDMTENAMRSIIESHLNTINPDANIEIAFYGGSFTGIEKRQQIEYLKTANKYIAEGKIRAIRLSTRPDYINQEILGYLKEYNVGTIELGVQSLDQETLDKSCRGHSVQHVLEASALIKNYGFNLGIQTMIGLPGDTRSKNLDTANKVIDIKPEVVRIYPVLVIKGTYLEKMFHDGLYTPINLSEAVDICAELLAMYQNNNINVIRIGLQPTETINENMDVVAGPFHPAFRQLVESKLFLNKIERYIDTRNLTDKDGIIIFAENKHISSIIGQKKANIYYLKKKYGFRNIKLQARPNMNSQIIIDYFK